MADSPKKLKDLKVADLKVELEKRGLAINGTKPVLIERLKGALEEEGHVAEEYNFNEEEKVEEATVEEVETDKA